VDSCLVIIRHGGIEVSRTKLIELVTELSATKCENAEVHKEYQALHQRLEGREFDMKELYDKFVELFHRNSVVERKFLEAEERISAMEQSLSWRLTAPLRSIGDKINSIK